MVRRADNLVGVLLAALLVPNAGPHEAKAPLSFETASVRPAAKGVQQGGFDFMRWGSKAAPRGLLK